MMAQAPVNPMQASAHECRTGGRRKCRPPAALWSVTPNGKVQRSDGRRENLRRGPRGARHKIHGRCRPWERCLGGRRGRRPLPFDRWWHHLDRVEINLEGSALTEAITGIQLHDPQHLTITTASGSAWASEDGGQHWQKP